jgi:PAS domain S-box-containing protein
VLVNTSLQALIIIQKGRIMFANPAATSISGYSIQELLDLKDPVRALIHPEDLPAIIERAERRSRGEAIVPFDNYRIVRKNGLVRWVESQTAHIEFRGEKAEHIVYIDITERKQMEEELQKTQKLESLGILAGGIAHDFNNLLGGIYGYIDLAGETAKEKELSQYLSKAMDTIERARGLTLQLLTFAKGGAPIKKTGTLFPFVQETAQFALSGSNISANFSIQENLWPCNFDKNQIGRVIDNIIINAKQAMPDGGTIELSAHNVSISGNVHPHLRNGDYVTISIKDCGIGMPKEILSRIFDPFYTTKVTGNGLGLASCHSIIKRHGGCIDVESELGKGSTFHLFLPAEIGADVSSTKETGVKHKGCGTFIVMDDQEFMRETIGAMLESLGYSVVCKESGKDAIDFVQAEIRAKRKIAGMLFDLTIPGGMGGKETIGEIRKLNPEAFAFATSGYAEDPIMANPNDYGFTASICKPFRRSELSEMLNKYMQPKN